MQRSRHVQWLMTIWVLAVFALLTLPVVMTGQKVSTPRLGGARGIVLGTKGEPLEGIGMQLISDKTAIRTTVYTGEDGRYEFPVLEAGTYTQRVPRPMEFQPYVKESVRIDGSTQLPEVRLSYVSDNEFLPPTDAILAQLTGYEWMMNLPGTGEEKRVFKFTCGSVCHSYQQIFRNHYDERSWRLILRQMVRGQGSTLIPQVTPTPTTVDRAYRSLLADEEFLPKWLARVSGPDSHLGPLAYIPREKGRATRVIVTEYELPRELLAPHDVAADSKGNIWYSAHRSAYSGVLDPRTGIVTEYRIPEADKDPPGTLPLPGAHGLIVDKNDNVWFAQNWKQTLIGLNAKTGKIIARYNRAGITSGNFAMDAAGFHYVASGGEVLKTDLKTGEIIQRFKAQTPIGGYDSIVTKDGRYFAAGLGYLDLKTGQYYEPETTRPGVGDRGAGMGPDIINVARGAFDLQNNAWFGGRNGALIEHDGKTHRIHEYYPPTSLYESFYEAMPDKNGEIWAGALQSGRFWRFSPTTQAWTGYMMPEPYAHDRRTWIDNSTTPVTVWFVDHNGYIVRIQPLD